MIGSTSRQQTHTVPNGQTMPDGLTALQRKHGLGGNCAGVFLITPEVAVKWLATCNDRNRSRNDTWVQQLAESIRRGEFKLNGDTIVFGCDSGWRLLNGQHRLNAVARAATPVWSWVIWGDGVEPGSFATYDVNRRRTGSTALEIAGAKNCTLLAAALTLLHAYQRQTVRSRPPVTPAFTLSLLAEHPKMAQSATFAMRHFGNKPVIPGSQAAVLHYLLSTNGYEAEVEEFLSRISDGASLPTGSPMLFLRDRMTADAKAKAKLPRYQIFALVIKAWNAFHRGESVKILRWSEGGGEPFPQIAGVPNVEIEADESNS